MTNNITAASSPGPKIHYFLTALWGLATPVLMAWGASAAISEYASESEHLGHPTPLEFFAVFLVIGVLCLALFLIYDLVVSVFLLPKDGKRLRTFFIALALYVGVGIGGWVVLALLEAGVRSIFG